MSQQNYNYYKSLAQKSLQVYLERMDHLLANFGEPFDGIPVSVFAHVARDKDDFTYPDSNKVNNLVREMNQVWEETKRKRPELEKFTVNFFSQTGAGRFPVLMIQVL